MRPAPDLSRSPVFADAFATFRRTYGHLFEHSPWVVERTWPRRPFLSAEGLLKAFGTTLDAASADERLALIRAHPELADKVAIAAGLTPDSAREQASAGLDALTPGEYDEFHALNRAYEARFGFPFVICVRLHDRSDILAAMRQRLRRPPPLEFAEAIRQVLLIVQFRLAEVSAPASPHPDEGTP